jgi:hypothetical protein
MAEPSFTPTVLSKVRRHPERAAYDEATVNAVLDASLVAHIGYVIDGRPFVTPTLFWREGRTLYWHGAAVSRALDAANGAPVCVTVSLADGLVLAPSGFAHSLNYRAVMAFGHARAIDDLDVRRACVDAFIERVYPGRAGTLRPPSEMELKTTRFMEMPIEEASAKIRAGGVAHLAADEGWGAWSGVLPIETRIGAPQPDTAIGALALGLSGAPPFLEGMRLDEALGR